MTTMTGPASSVFEALAAAQYAPVEQCVTARDAMLYALGIGFGDDPLDASQLKFVYEKDLRIFPTMAVTLCYASTDKRTHSALDMRKVLHAFQGFELHVPIPLECPLEGQTRITGVFDKGADRGVLWTYETLVREKASGTLVCTLFCASMSLIGGGIGGPRGESRPKKPVPSRAPDAVCELATLPQSALIYRLSGDYNPFHVDSEMARQGGFPRPILHGRCTFGITGRAIVREICAGDERRLRKMEARFSSPVFPGETIRTEMWKEGATVEFRTSVSERNVVVLEQGRAELG